MIKKYENIYRLKLREITPISIWNENYPYFSFDYPNPPDIIHTCKKCQNLLGEI